MPDLALTFGGDLQFDPDGDLALANGPTLTEQRVLRRLLTNNGDYIWQLVYGAGLARYIGQPGAIAIVSGLVRSQLTQENQISANPAPQINVAENQSGNFTMSLQYTDANTSQTDAIQFSI